MPLCPACVALLNDGTRVLTGLLLCLWLRLTTLNKRIWWWWWWWWWWSFVYALRRTLSSQSYCPRHHQVVGSSTTTSMTPCSRTARKKTCPKTSARQRGKSTSARNSAFTSARWFRPGISHHRIPPRTTRWRRGLRQLVRRSPYVEWFRTFRRRGLTWR